jgi:uncharacterized protein
MIVRFLTLLLLLVAAPVAAQKFPPLSGRVVDQAGLLTPADEAELGARLEALQKASSRQLVIATVSSLDGYEIEDYGYRLGRHWGIGQKEADNGLILLVAPKERKVRIEVGTGLEAIVTDAFSSIVINQTILPAFKAGDYPGGIKAGADALIGQLQAPPELAEQNALQAARQQEQQQASSGDGDGSIAPLVFWGIVIFFAFILPMMRGGRRGRRHRRGGVFLWGPGLGGGWGGGSGGGGGFGGFSGGGGGGGFSGGGGGFGGGGASGGW